MGSTTHTGGEGIFSLQLNLPGNLHRHLGVCFNRGSNSHQGDSHRASPPSCVRHVGILSSTSDQSFHRAIHRFTLLMSLSRETHSTAHEQRVGHWYLIERYTVMDGPSMGLCKYTEASWVCAGTSLAHRAGITQVFPEQETPEFPCQETPTSGFGSLWPPNWESLS